MDSLEVEGVPCFLHSEIQSEKVPELPANFPFRQSLLDGLVETCPVLTHVNEDPRAFNIFGTQIDSAVGLKRISSEHGRSFELTYGNANQDGIPIALWEDEFENVYSALSFKGNNFTNPHIFRNLTAPSGYVPYGLLETDSLLRVIKASNVMREAGIDTEMIVKVLEPEFFRAKKLDEETGAFSEDEYEYVPLPEFKRRLLLNHWQTNEEETDLEEFQKISEAINKMAFFITVRATSIGTRLSDLIRVEPDDEGAGKELEKIFKILDILVEEGDEGKSAVLDTNNPEDIKRYFLDILPRSIGANLGLLHKTGLVHTFPHSGNVNIFGGLVDLDSVKGPNLGLGDEELTLDDYKSDLTYFTSRGDIEQRLNITSLMYAYMRLANIEKNIFREREDAARQFRGVFMASYLDHRFDPFHGDLSEKDALEFTEHIDTYSHSYFLRDYYFYDVILERHLEDLDFPTLFTELDESQTIKSVIEWDTANFMDKFMNRVNSVIQETPLYLLENWAGHYEILDKCCDDYFIDDLKAYKREQIIQPKIWSEESDTLIREWLKDHKKVASAWSDDTLTEFIKRSVLEKIDEKLAKATNTLNNDFRSFMQNVDLHIGSIFTVPDNLADNRFIKFVLNGNLFAAYDKFDVETLVDNLIVGNDEYVKDLRGDLSVVIKVDEQKDEDKKLTSTFWSHIKEIFVDGTLSNMNASVPSNKLDGAGTITIKSDSFSKFYAWTKRDKNIKSTTLNIRVFDEFDKYMIEKSLEAKGFELDKTKNRYKLIENPEPL